jgi:hypothetical protein
MRFKRSFTLVTGVVIVTLCGAAGYPALAASPSLPHAVSTAAPTLVPYLPGTDSPNESGPPDVETVVDGVTLTCWDVLAGFIYSVNATNIHIWNEPGGSPEWEINKGAWFDTLWDFGNDGPYHCLSLGTYDGSTWVYGIRNYDYPNGSRGFVGLQYLDIEYYDE